jgi:hypothetical protein
MSELRNDMPASLNGDVACPSAEWFRLGIASCR